MAENKKNIKAMKKEKMLDDAIEDASPDLKTKLIEKRCRN